MTQTITEPETTDIPIEIAPTDEACTAKHDWCARGCVDSDPDDADWQNDAYHCGAVAPLSMLRFTRAGWQDLSDVSLLICHDENEGDDSRPLIQIVYPTRECTPAMTAEQARQNAAALLSAADILDPLPTGALVTTASKVRIGDELLTSDGWQTVTGLVLDSAIEMASVFTPEHGGDMDSDDGWDLSFNDTALVRRPVHGSCAIQFVEPPTGGAR